MPPSRQPPRSISEPSLSTTTTPKPERYPDPSWSTSFQGFTSGYNPSNSNSNHDRSKHWQGENVSSMTRTVSAPQFSAVSSWIPPSGAFADGTLGFLEGPGYEGDIDSSGSWSLDTYMSRPSGFTEFLLRGGSESDGEQSRLLGEAVPGFVRRGDASRESLDLYAPSHSSGLSGDKTPPGYNDGDADRLPTAPTANEYTTQQDFEASQDRQEQSATTNPNYAGYIHRKRHTSRRKPPPSRLKTGDNPAPRPAHWEIEYRLKTHGSAPHTESPEPLPKFGMLNPFDLASIPLWIAEYRILRDSNAWTEILHGWKEKTIAIAHGLSDSLRWDHRDVEVLALESLEELWFITAYEMILGRTVEALEERDMEIVEVNVGALEWRFEFYGRLLGEWDEKRRRERLQGV